MDTYAVLAPEYASLAEGDDFSGPEEAMGLDDLTGDLDTALA
ncbi:hypothetical protein [Streptomyces virginiae]|nr:hypothetical protein [Streptomyces virginiae]MCX4960054.1 hypothetical protein [Streptomyces virginiae]